MKNAEVYKSTTTAFQQSIPRLLNQKGKMSLRLPEKFEI